MTRPTTLGLQLDDEYGVTARRWLSVIVTVKSMQQCFPNGHINPSIKTSSCVLYVKGHKAGVQRLSNLI